VVIKRSSSADVARLLADVLGGHEVAREAAIARLSIIGTRAVDRVLAALDGATPPAAAALLTVLERVGDARALDPAIACLADADDRLATAAVGVLRRLLAVDRTETSTAALDALAGALLDTGRSDTVRGAALDALHELPDEVVAPLRARLIRDPSRQLRRQAGWPATHGDGAEAGEPAAVRDAGAPGPATLEAYAEGPLPDRPGPLCDELARTAHTVPLSVLHRLVVAAQARATVERAAGTTREWQRAHAALHLALGRRGSRVALYDLRETLGSHAAGVPSELFAAAALIGDPSCLEPLAERATRDPDREQRTRALDALRRIEQRERLTRRHAVVKRLAARYPAIFAR
jgi:HEAT repeat protein